MTMVYFRGAHFALVVFDLNDEKSFEKTRFWIDNIKEKSKANTIIYLVGNKLDLPQLVEESKINELINFYGIKYFKTSAQVRVGIDEIF